MSQAKIMKGKYKPKLEIFPEGWEKGDSNQTTLHSLCKGYGYFLGQHNTSPNVKKCILKNDHFLLETEHFDLPII